MKQYVCSVCSYTYDEAKGIPEAGIAPGTKWEDLPEDWKCPWCKADKSAFRVKEEQTAEPEKTPDIQAKKPHMERELSAMEMSIICSNLAKGCEKQYLPEEAETFLKLAEFFRKEGDTQKNDETDIAVWIERDLKTGYPYANQTASAEPDRGALRSLVWSEKVTRMLQSLLARYEKEGERMLEHTGVWVCTICGFVYLGDTPPARCPVCKVPDWKFEKVERRG